jgi:hypothetical protein
VHGQPQFFPHLPQQVDRAARPAAKAEVFADDDPAGAKSSDQHVPHEPLRLQRRDRFIEP